MAGGIDPNASLDYIEFQIFPSQNRYEACVCCGNRKETVTSGPLAQLLRHLDKAKTLNSDRGSANFKLEPPENLGNSKWFTKSTLLRFVHIIGSSDMLDTANAVVNEISQLEEARRFHLSLYTKDPCTHHQGGETESSYSNTAASMAKAEGDTVSADSSKNELLRAMDLRLTALRGELTSALDEAASAACSLEEIINLEKFSHYFGATVLRKTLLKIIEMNQDNMTADLSSDEQSLSGNDSRNDRAGSGNKDNNMSIPSNSETPVKYGVSPAKAAQLERQSSSESEESSNVSEEDQPSVERSRTLIRSASPRRSASPMRRIQIGRSGSRRPTPLTIKSLNYFPGREKIVCQKDAAVDSTDEEGSEEPSRKSDYNVQRISVQDAISLFESKQKEQIVDIQKARSLLNASVSANKSVLRRWSAGMGESSSKCPSDVASEKSVPAGATTMEGGEVVTDSPEAKVESNLASNGHPAELSDVNVQLNSPRESGSSPVGIQEDALPPETAEMSEKFSASAEWSRQKEAELNQLLMKMMETKPVKNRSTVPDLSKSLNIPTERRGSFYDHYKEKRDEKLQAGKRVEKEKQFRAMQQILEERKAAMASNVPNGIGGRQNVKKSQKPLKNASQSLTSKKAIQSASSKKATQSASSKKETQSANSKKETSKPAAVRKTSQKASSFPATRKSWPSTPLPGGTGTSPATTPGGLTAGSKVTRRQSQPAPSATRSSPKVEGSQLRSKPVKASPSDVMKNTKGVIQNKQQTVPKTGKTTKTKVQTTSVGVASSEKPSIHGKVTKKSSVVPLESKPFLRKGSGIGSGVGPTIKTKPSPLPEESLRKSGDLIPAKENETISNSSDTVIEQLERDVEALQVHADTIAETEVNRPQVCEDAEIPTQVISSIDESAQKIAESSLKTEAEEEMLISPAAWVEIEEGEHQPVLCNDSILQIESPTKFAPVKMSSPRVRHSLSQMLLEENSEPDVIEWGNAEEPPSMIYQKDAPKGLKRLLKFARKSKTDASSTGWSSPSVFSEGEDDGEESKAVYKKNAENLLKKATLRAKHDGLLKNSSCEAYEENPSAHELSAQANTSKFTAQSLSQKLQDSHATASMTTTKASRSFFSLSAFKGGKQNETKFR